ncbi:zinc finger protein Xfin, partial [Acanthochromis polyacanthus]
GGLVHLPSEEELCGPVLSHGPPLHPGADGAVRSPHDSGSLSDLQTSPSSLHVLPRPEPSSPPDAGSTPGRLSCLLCPLTLPSRRLLDVHVRSHRPAGGFSCICCRWTADSWEELQPHWNICRRRRKEELGDRRRRKRAACRRTFRNTAARNAPTHKHSRSSDEWREQLTGRAEGKEAVRLDRAPADSLQNVSETKKKTRRKEGMEGSEQPGFTCSLCHGKFSSKLTLRRHLGVHGGDKPFTCPHCTYSSRLKASLLQHLRTHTGEKPYRCAECPYASIDRSSLLRHSRTHSQVKPYRCQHCDYSSIQKKSLDLHARRHHTGEAFPCQQCDYSSPDRQLLLRHVRRHHAPSHHAAL